jgi:hypothetical protein
VLLLAFLIFSNGTMAGAAPANAANANASATATVSVSASAFTSTPTPASASATALAATPASASATTSTAAPAAGPSAFAASSQYETVLVPKVKTSIYIGSVTLTMMPLKRGADQVYTADYKATVIPFFIFNESGQFRIMFTDEQLARLATGERVEFSGDGKNKGGSPRPITGHATADAPGAKTGKIKVRVFVTKKTALVFDTTYAFESPAVATPTEKTTPPAK